MKVNNQLCRHQFVDDQRRRLGFKGDGATHIIKVLVVSALSIERSWVQIPRQVRDLLLNLCSYRSTANSARMSTSTVDPIMTTYRLS